MYLQRLLQIHLATLASLAALLLSLGQESVVRPLVVLLAAVVALWVADIGGWLRLNRTAASIAAVPAVIYAMRQFLAVPNEARLLAFGDLMIYLQVILLFQKKDSRVYWQLLAISLIEVITAAGFSQGVWFGMLLVVYMLVALSALSLLFLHGESCRYQAGEPSGSEARKRSLKGTVPFSGRRFASPAENRDSPQAENRDSPRAEPRSRPRRWPLASEPPRMAGSPAGSSRGAIVPELFARLGLVGVGTLVLATVIFFTMPRLGRSAWRGSSIASRTVVGFTDVVELGSLGEILESRQEVMRVEFHDPEVGKPFQAEGEVYLRGAVLTQYDRGQWRRDGGGQPPGPVGLLRNLAAETWNNAPPPRTRAVVERITVDPLDRDELFCVWPFYAESLDNGVLLDRRTARLMRHSGLRGQRFRFQLWTPALADRRQARLTPCDPNECRVFDPEWPGDLAALVEMPELPQLARQAEGWIKQSAALADDRYALAVTLEQRLSSSERYTYSLRGQPRNPNLDPIEDFIAEHPTGHCEYFATALAMMLRSQGIPSRVIVGYKTDEWNSPGKFYQVRQCHAHAWVEAYLEPRHIPSVYRDAADGDRWARGAWLRLDATPFADDPASGADALRRSFDWIESFWSNYIVEMDSQRQAEAIYQPLFRWLREAASRLRDPDWWRGLAGVIARRLSIAAAGGVAAWLLRIVFPLAGLALVGVWLCRRAWRALRRVLRRGNGAVRAPARRADVDFYRKLESLLARRGIARAAGQTPREFARSAATRLAAQPATASAAAIPEDLAEAFYAVRFGGLPLGDSQIKTVESRLVELELALKGRR